jgi:lysosomal acid lipase/cholesteryl ester hydrolase
LNNPQESLAFILADAGYDVWLGNNRGNGISMDNTKYNPSQPQFWDFSFDEMAQYDLPGQIDYILKTTGEKKIFYIGHSEGTIQAFAGFLDPELASKVKIFIALAPVAHVGHVTSPILQAMAKLGTDVIFELLGLHEFYLPSVIHKILPGYCTLFPHMCEFVLDIIAGPFPNVNLTRIPYYLNYEPNPTSVKNMAHWFGHTVHIIVFDFH